MLARVANNLYWIGRYVERADCSCRYLMVNYHSTLDADMHKNKDFVLRSILYMSETEWSTKFGLSEAEIFQEVLYNNANPSSVASMIGKTRENARSIRNNISTELWETINVWYFSMQEAMVRQFTVDAIFPTIAKHRQHISLLRSDINNTLLRNNVWHFIMLGILVERIQQVIKMLKSKISDYNILSENGKNESLLVYQYIILLRCVEAYDLHRLQNRGHSMSLSSIFNLILTNPLFPRSINFIITNCQFHYNNIEGKSTEDTFIDHEFTRIISSVNTFKDYGNEENILTFLENVDSWATNLHLKISELYFQ